MADRKQLSNLRISALHVNSTRAALIVHGVDESGNFVSPGAGSTQVSIKEILTSSGASVMDSTEGAIKVNVVAGAAGGSTTVTVRQSTAADLRMAALLTDRDASTNVANITNTTPASTAYGLVVRLPAPFTDSSNNAIRVFQAASSAGAGSTEVTIRQSTYTDLQTLSRLADRDSSTQVANITNTTPASTAYALVVREAVAPSTTVNVSSLAGAVVVRSSAADALVTVYQSTAAGLNAAVVQGSTVWLVQIPSSQSVQVKNSTIGDLLASVQQNSTVWAVQVDGRVRAQNSTIGDLLASVQQNSTVWQVQIPTSQSIQVKNSTIGDLLASVQQNSTVWQTQAAVRTSSGGAVEGSTTAPAVGVIGLHMRQVFPTMQSTTIVITSTHSTAIYPIVSSVAGLRHKVYAYFIGSTHTNPSTLIFCSSISNSGFDHWAANFGSGSSGITGANLALTPPGFIFGGVSQNALNIKIEGGSSVTATCVARVSLSWFDEA